MLARLNSGKTEDSRVKNRREKRSAIAEAQEEELLHIQEESKTLKVTEFISAKALALLMGV